MKRWAFMLSHSNIILFALPFWHHHSFPTPLFLSLSNSTWTIYFIYLPATIHNIWPLIYYIYIWREREMHSCSLSFLQFVPFFSFFFQTSKVRQDNKCHWCLLELWTPLAAIGFQGNTLTINFQLKQTKSWQHGLYGRCQESVLIYDKWA